MASRECIYNSGKAKDVDAIDVNAEELKFTILLWESNNLVITDTIEEECSYHSFNSDADIANAC